MSLRDLGCRGFNKHTPVGRPRHALGQGDVMSTYMDLLFLGGYIAPPPPLPPPPAPAAAVPGAGTRREPRPARPAAPPPRKVSLARARVRRRRSRSISDQRRLVSSQAARIVNRREQNERIVQR